MGSTDRQHDRDPGTTVSLICGTVLALAASRAGGEAVRTEVVDVPDLERLELRLFIGQQSALISFAGIDVAKVLGDTGVRRAVEERTAEAIAALHAT